MKVHQVIVEAHGRKFIVALMALSLLGISGTFWKSRAAEASSQSSATAKAASTGGCCKAGDTTPPTKLVKEMPKGQLKSPYKDFAKVAQEGHQQFLNAGCNGCHGGTGGGGMCPPLNQGVWFFGSSGDTLFRLITLGSDGLQKEGFTRLAQGAVKGPMPPMGSAIPTSDDLWKIIAWIRSINPTPTPVPPFPKAYER
jgi:mono/diheme cytochrome c family protein